MEPGPGSALRKSIDQYAVLYEPQQMTHRGVAALLPERSLPCVAGQGGAKTIVRYGRKTRMFPMEGLPEDRESPGKGPCLKGESSPVELNVLVGTLLAYGCPHHTIVHAYDLD